jgi:hypothetical protein
MLCFLSFKESDFQALRLRGLEAGQDTKAAALYRKSARQRCS